TVIWSCVSVPVLSVQMKVVEPSVSTASRLRTSTFRFAICSAPQASDSVTVGSSASGTSATVTPMAKVNPSAAVSPRTTATRKNTAPTPTAMRATVCTSRRSSRARGPGGAGSAGREAGDLGQPRPGAGGGDDRLTLPLDDEAPGVDPVALLDG